MFYIFSIPDAETVWKKVDADGDGEAAPEELVDVIKQNTGLDAESAKWVAHNSLYSLATEGNFSNHFHVFLSFLSATFLKP